MERRFPTQKRQVPMQTSEQYQDHRWGDFQTPSSPDTGRAANL